MYCSLAVVLFLLGEPAASYKVGYVEHTAISPCGSGSCGAETKRQNIAAYAKYAQQAASKGANIIVFPEYGITGFSSYPASQWGDYAEQVPDVKGRIVPCDASSSFSSAPSLVSLSCAAKKNGVAIVANMVDQPSSNKVYNTDVAFDTDGTYLAKYHKTNLWGEFNMAVPTECADASFTTSFGVTFGLFTCADLIYKFPVDPLLKKGIRDFLVPVAWDDSMAQMQVMGFAQGWSLDHKVNLVVCNHRTSAESGSGVWASGKPLDYYFSPGQGDGQLRVADVSSTDLVYSPLLHGSAMGVHHAPQLGSLFPPAGSAWKFVELSVGKVCTGSSLCCSASVNGGSTAGYVLAALDGSDTNDGMKWAAQVCAVLPCSSPSQKCLSFQSSSGSLSELTLSATGMGSSSVFPEVVATSSGHSEIMLTPDDPKNGITFTAGESPSLTISTQSTILSATLYGRKFAADQLPYSCDPSDIMV